LAAIFSDDALEACAELWHLIESTNDRKVLWHIQVCRSGSEQQTRSHGDSQGPFLAIVTEFCHFTLPLLFAHELPPFWKQIVRSSHASIASWGVTHSPLHHIDQRGIDNMALTGR
jgi:hypothetical protein